MSNALDTAILEGLDEMESYDIAMNESELIDIVSDDMNDDLDGELIDDVDDDIDA